MFQTNTVIGNIGAALETPRRKSRSLNENGASKLSTMQDVLNWIAERNAKCPELDVARFPFDRDVDYAAWKAARFDFIGASTIPTVVGLNPYKSRRALWREYVARESSYVDNPNTRMGHWVEPFIQREVEIQNPCYKIYPYNLSHLGPHGFDSATPDGLMRHQVRQGLGVNEVKCTSAKKELDIWKSGRAPARFRAQLMWQMGVMGLKWGVITAMVEGNPRIYVKEYTFDEEEYNEMVESAREFMQQVETKTEPPRKRPVRKKKSPFVGNLDEIVKEILTEKDNG